MALSIQRADIEDFLYHEAALLDEWQMEEWDYLDGSHYDAKLSDHDCNVLCDTVLARFTRDRRKDGKWYGK